MFSQSIERVKHSGIESAFSQFLVKPGLIEQEYSRLYQQARRQREKADYVDEATIDEVIAQQVLADAERFVDRIKQFLNEIGAL